MRLLSNSKLRSVESAQHRAGRAVHAPSKRPSYAHLAIPRLTPGIPGKISKFSQDIPLWAQFALCWLETKEINDQDTGSASELVNLALGRWVNRHTGELKHLSFVVRATLEHPFGDYPDSDVEPDSGLHLLFDHDFSCFYDLETKMTSLYTLHPDLAMTAIHWLGLAGCRTLNLLTPWRGRDMATDTWWYYQDNQKDFLEEHAIYYEVEAEEVEVNEDLFGPDQWDAAFPDWIRSPEKKLNRRKLKEIAKSHQDSWVRTVASVVAEIDQLQDAEIQGVEQWDQASVYSAALFRWNKADPMERLFDDFINRANESSDYFTSYFGMETLPLEIAAFKQKKKSMEKAFQMIQKLDRLIDLIADIDNERNPNDTD